MTVPVKMPPVTPDVIEDVSHLLIAEAEHQNVSVDSLRPLDIQVLAYGCRLAATDQHLLDVANALDELSSLSPPDVTFLEDLAKNPPSFKLDVNSGQKD